MSAPRVLVVGAGGVGHPAVRALREESALRLRVVDEDRVEKSNLHRLLEATEEDVGRSKLEVLARARAPFAHPEDEWLPTRFLPDNAAELLRGVDLVLEGSDNYATRFLVADAAFLAGVPSVHGAAVGWLGTVLPVLPERSACYRCIFEDLPPGDALDCSSAGVFGPVTTVVGSLLAADGLRLLAGDASRAGVLAAFDGRRNSFREVRLHRRAACPLCGERTLRALDPSRYAPARCDL